MKRLKDLTKKQRNNYMTKNKIYFNNSKYGYEDADIKYIFENNSIDEIKEWFEHHTSTNEIPNTPTDVISVYMHNRIYERLQK